jgi:hypothetical protein
VLVIAIIYINDNQFFHRHNLMSRPSTDGKSGPWEAIFAFLDAGVAGLNLDVSGNDIAAISTC